MFKLRLPGPPSVTVALFFGAVVGAITAMVVPNSASAAVYCTGHYMDDMSTISNHYGVGVNPTASTAYGMYGFNHAPQTCTYTSSVLVRDPNVGDVEVGWIDGVVGVFYSKDTSKPTQGCHDSVTGDWSVGKGYPEAFRATVRLGDTGFVCTVFPSVTPTQGQYHTVDIRNTDQNSTWSVHLDGSNLGGGSLTMPFTSAQSWTNGEQYGGNELADASFRGLKFMNNSAGWQDWTGAMCRYPRTIPSGLTDPYNSHIQTAYTWIQVSATGSEC